jgi:hypothetical protein
MGMAASSIGEIRDAVAHACRVPVEHVFLSLTHVHSGPDVVIREISEKGEEKGDFRQDYFDRLIKWSVKAAKAAQGNAEDCELRYNFANVEQNMNRRYCFPDRRFLYIPQNKQLAGQSTEYVDHELGLVVFRKRGTSNRYKAILTNYTAHPVCIGNSSNLVSADYPGVLRKHVEQTFEGCLCVTTTGATGDIHPLVPEGGFAAAEEMGTRLGQVAVARCYDAVSADSDTRLRLAYPAVTLQYRDRATQQMLPEKRFRQQELRWTKKEHKTYVSLLGIGPILLAGFPGEPVAELGAMLKWSSPFLRTYVLFISTDVLAYYPTVNQHYWGGFEVDSSPFVCGTGEFLVRSIVDTAWRMIREQPLSLPELETR